MNSQRTLTVAIIDVPYESSNSSAAVHIIREALREGHNVRVLDCEAPENPAIKAQQAHARSVDGKTVSQKERSLSKEREASLFQFANERGVTLDWVNCNLTDETGAEDRIAGPRSIGPKDLVDASLTSDATVVILIPK